MNLVAYRRFRKAGDDIDPTPQWEIKEVEYAKLKATGDKWHHDLITYAPRHVVDGKVRPYDEHPAYLERMEKQKKEQEKKHQESFVEKKSKSV